MFIRKELNLFLVILWTVQGKGKTCSSYSDDTDSKEKIKIEWIDDTFCHGNKTIVNRNCTEESWNQEGENSEPCIQVLQDFDLTACPPGFQSISKNNIDFCYQVIETSAWEYPCFKSGGASVITDLNKYEINSLLDSLTAENRSRYFWLPAARNKILHPIIWTVPGPNWGKFIDNQSILNIQTSLFKNCLLLDIQERLLTTEACTKEHPSLCLYINDIHYPTSCPEGYIAYRFLLDDSTCFGIEQAEGLTFDDFLRTKCKKPMGNSKYYDLAAFTFLKIAEIEQIPDDSWCWFMTANGFNISANSSATSFSALEGVINRQGTLSLMNKSMLLPCMACEAEVIYGNSELLFEYNNEDEKIYITIYYPSGLWKYNENDKGIQCFSNANGFVNVIYINDVPVIETFAKLQSNITIADDVTIEKTVYTINIFADRSAQYWCEGHTKNFTFIQTEKVIVNPRSNEIHVFSLILKMFVCENEIEFTTVINNIESNLVKVFNAEKVLVMSILEYTANYMILVAHLHVVVDNMYDNKSHYLNITFNKLEAIANTELSAYNYTFINISSAVYCLPTTTFSHNSNLDWELTPIGHITAPLQFCLQVNGLPVKRMCSGSYTLGGYWGEVEGECNPNYQPSNTTTFLYNFMQGHKSDNNETCRFLTEGLNFVLDDISTIIPADIYYLSMSLQRVLNLAHENMTSVEMGDVHNIASVMNRVMLLNNMYLRLSQSLNSTNVIVDSINDIIEILAENISYSIKDEKVKYEIAVEPQFAVQISYPQFNNITGIALARTNKSDKFTKMKVIPLFKNTTINDILIIQNLEIATWLPNNLVDSLKKNTNDTCYYNASIDPNLHVIISIFYNDSVFQELDTSKHNLNSRIIGISIPGYKTNLELPVPLIFRDIYRYYNTEANSQFCGYWDFNFRKSGKNPGYWTNEGCYLLRSINNLSICECYHLTHFGQLLALRQNNQFDDSIIVENHVRALNIITIIGSTLSLLGIIGIWLTAVVFKMWRKKAGTKVLLHLSTAIAIPLVILLVFNLEKNMFIHQNGTTVIAENMIIFCITFGALLHYSILASFMWMLITAILQFIRYVRVLGVSRPSRFMIKFALIGWGIPVFPVISVLILDVNNYTPNSDCRSEGGCLCYPRGIYLIVSIVLPICLILIVNIVLFGFVIYAISHGPDGKMRATDIDLICAQLRLSVILFFLMGLTWIFGIFSFSNNLIWSYLFSLTSSLQGFILFIYFVICDPSTRNLWVTLMVPQRGLSSSRNSVTSISSCG